MDAGRDASFFVQKSLYLNYRHAQLLLLPALFLGGFGFLFLGGFEAPATLAQQLALLFQILATLLFLLCVAACLIVQQRCTFINLRLREAVHKELESGDINIHTQRGLTLAVSRHATTGTPSRGNFRPYYDLPAKLRADWRYPTSVERGSRDDIARGEAMMFPPISGTRVWIFVVLFSFMMGFLLQVTSLAFVFWVRLVPPYPLPSTSDNSTLPSTPSDLWSHSAGVTIFVVLVAILSLLFIVAVTGLINSYFEVASDVYHNFPAHYAYRDSDAIQNLLREVRDELRKGNGNPHHACAQNACVGSRAAASPPVGEKTRLRSNTPNNIDNNNNVPDSPPSDGGLFPVEKMQKAVQEEQGASCGAPATARTGIANDLEAGQGTLHRSKEPRTTPGATVMPLVIDLESTRNSLEPEAGSGSTALDNAPLQNVNVTVDVGNVQNVNIDVDGVVEL